jgi:FMNH2-dependent dimethyl sulfone monooxygenase
MRFGLWLPVYGGWLRARGFDSEPSFETCLTLAGLAESLGYSVLYASENFLNCVHGPAHDVADAWTVLAALAGRTQAVTLVGGIKPGFRPSLVAAQMIATADRISGGRVGINIACGWWRREFEHCGVLWRTHDQKYADAEAYLRALQQTWAATGEAETPRRALFGRVRPTVWIGGHSEAALRFAASQADVLFVNGMSPEDIAALRARIARLAPTGRAPLIAMNAFVILAADHAAAERRRREVAARARPELIALYRAALAESGAAAWAGAGDDELIDPNGGFASALVGNVDDVARRLAMLERAGVDLVMCQFTDMASEAEAFGRSVIPRLSERAGAVLQACSGGGG